MALGPLLAADIFSRVFGRLFTLPIVGVAVRLTMPIFRTAGFFFNKALGAREKTPRERLLLGVTLGFPAGINPFIFSFLSGLAYESTEELTEGWLSAFGELLFKDAPGVEGDLEVGLKAAGRTDFRGVMDAIADAFAGETGLEDASAFFRGLGAAASDFQSLTGVALPLNWIGDGIIWLDRAVRGFFDPLPRPPTAPTFRPGEVVPLDPGLRRGLEKKLPGAVKRLTMRIISEGPQAVLFRIGETVSQGVKDKLRNLVLGRLGSR